MAQVDKFSSLETCKRGLIICTDPATHEWNYTFANYGSGWMPCDNAGSWTDKCDLEEDGDFKRELHYTRYLFEAATPLQVRREALSMLKIYMGRTNRTYNDKLGF